MNTDNDIKYKIKFINIAKICYKINLLYNMARADKWQTIKRVGNWSPSGYIIKCRRWQLNTPLINTNYFFLLTFIFTWLLNDIHVLIDLLHGGNEDFFALIIIIIIIVVVVVVVVVNIIIKEKMMMTRWWWWWGERWWRWWWWLLSLLKDKRRNRMKENIGEEKYL